VGFSNADYTVLVALFEAAGGTVCEALRDTAVRSG
jgi:hypothetical protein